MLLIEGFLIFDGFLVLLPLNVKLCGCFYFCSSQLFTKQDASVIATGQLQRHHGNMRVFFHSFCIGLIYIVYLLALPESYRDVGAYILNESTDQDLSPIV